MGLVQGRWPGLPPRLFEERMAKPKKLDTLSKRIQHLVDTYYSGMYYNAGLVWNVPLESVRAVARGKTKAVNLEGETHWLKNAICASTSINREGLMRGTGPERSTDEPVVTRPVATRVEPKFATVVVADIDDVRNDVHMNVYHVQVPGNVKSQEQFVREACIAAVMQAYTMQRAEAVEQYNNTGDDFVVFHGHLQSEC